MKMKRSLVQFVIIILLLLAANSSIRAQDLGLSFSYFIPKNGYFSVPVTPFSIRGVGFDLSRVIAIESGFSLYRMSGMNVRDVPFETKEPVIGPFFSIFVPVELVFSFDLGGPIFKVKGGGFGFYNFATKVNEGNLDRVLLEYTGWTVLNSDYSVKNKLGIGYHFGGEILFYLNDRFGISLEAYYLNGGSKLEMQGSYTGVENNGEEIKTVAEDFPDAVLDFRGYELSIGVIFTP
jgi:hypothetical protein